MNRVFIANFGRGNYAWDRCREMPSVATMNDADLHHFWLTGDRDGHIEFCIRNKKTARGDTPPRSLASRWFNLMTIIAESENDLWFHRDGNNLWWTISRAEPPIIDDEPRAVPYQTLNVFECHKPCQPWSNRDQSGRRLTWDGMHPKAKDFITTESTLQALSPDYAKYVLALIEGVSLEPWHSRPLWRSKLSAKTEPGRHFTPREISVADMAFQAMQTSSASNGQTVERKLKNKEFGFKDQEELKRLLQDLLEAQGDRCALSGLPLQFRGSHDDDWMLCSLDRIDSNGHYERDNLQIVCRFINFWKSNMENDLFKRLLGTLGVKLSELSKSENG